MIFDKIFLLSITPFFLLILNLKIGLTLFTLHCNFRLNKAGPMVQALEHLTSKVKTLSSNFSTAKRKKKGINCVWKTQSSRMVHFDFSIVIGSPCYSKVLI